MRKLFSVIIALILLCGFMGATTWYVRPAGGVYGAEDGTTYADAWDGLKNIVWGGAGVVAGDTLYVCGLHLYEHTAGAVGADRTVTMIGGSVGNEITIRGDYPADDGIIWGGALMKHEAWFDEGGNTWSITCPAIQNSQVWYFEDVTAGSWTVLTAASDVADCKATAGSHYSTDYQAPSKLYVHCTDGLIPTNRITENTVGWLIQMLDISYVNWQDLQFYVPKVIFNYNSPTNAINYFTWTDCTIWYGDAILMLFHQGSNYNTWDGCDLGWAKNGLAFGESVPGNGSTTPHNITVKNCLIHNMGVMVPDGDAHAVSWQGGHDNLVEHNEMDNCGSSIVIYCYPNQRAWDNTIRYNYVHDTHNSGGIGMGRGIAFNIGTGLPQNDGNKIYGNIVADTFSDGIRSTWSYNVDVFNNVVYNAGGHSFNFSNTSETVMVTFKNNISLSPTSYHVRFVTNEPEGAYVIDSDNNDFFPISGNQFCFDDGGGAPVITNFAGWQALVKTDCVFDPNSITDDPSLVGDGYDEQIDFYLDDVGDPPVDAGVNVGLGEDIQGDTIPSGAAPDIGVDEYDQGDAGTHKMILKPGLKIIIGSGGKIIIKEPDFPVYIPREFQ